MLLHITIADIELGDRGVCGTCPVARSMTRSGLVDPQVYRERVWWTQNDWPVSFVVPDAVRRFVQNFDRGEPVSPLTWEIPDTGHLFGEVRVDGVVTP